MSVATCAAEGGLERALVALEARGARAYDAPACDCVRALLERATELGGGIAERLQQRARVHLDALTSRFDENRARVAASLCVAEERLGPQPELRSSLARGDLTQIARRLRKLQVVRPSGPELRAGSASMSPAMRPSGPFVTRRRRVLAYEDSVARLVATLALARATDVVPADAGPYNPLRIASELLDRMREVSPLYLTVQLNRLEELGSMLSLPELPPKPADKPRALQKAPPARGAARRAPKR